MKKLTAVILTAAMTLAAVNTSFAEDAVSPVNDYTVYAFETGMPTGFNKTGGANTSLGEGFSNSVNSLKVTLGAGSANSSVQIPVYWTEGREYKISFYFKPIEGHTLQTIRPLIYDVNKLYDFTEPAVNIENLTSVGDGWYYYSAVYNAGKKPFATGKGTIELRTTRSNVSDGSEYLIDDLVVEPVEGYSNVLFEEDFENAALKVQNYNTSSSVAVKEDGTNHYGEISSASASPRMRSKANIAFKSGAKYRFTYSVKGISDNTNNTKVMWGINSVSGYFCNVDTDKMSTSEWKTYSIEYAPPADYTNYIFSTSQGSVTNAAYALDDIKLEEIIPQAAGVSVSGKPEVGETLTATITGDAGLKYIYRAVTVDDNGNEAIAARGTLASNVITYTPKESDAGKTIKFIVTAYDDNHDYNTVKSEATAKIENKKTSLKFTSPLGTTITGEAVQYECESAVAFMSAFDADGRLIGIKYVTVPNGEKKELSLTLAKTPALTKLAMFNSVKTLDSVVREVTLNE